MKKNDGGSVLLAVLAALVVVGGLFFGVKTLKGGDTKAVKPTPTASASAPATAADPTPSPASNAPSVAIPPEVADKVPDAFLGSAAAFIKAVADTHDVNLDLHVGPKGDPAKSGAGNTGFTGNSTSVRRGFFNRGRDLQGSVPMPVASAPPAGK